MSYDDTDGVVEDIELSLISDDYVDRMQERVEKLKTIAREAEEAKKALEGAGISPSDTATNEVDAPSGGIFGGETGKFIDFKKAQQISGGVSGSATRDVVSRAPAPHDPMTGEFLKMQDDIEAMKEAMDLLRAETIKHKMTLQELKQKESQVIGGISQGLGAIRNPFGFIQGKMFGMLAKIALPIGAVVMIAQTVFEMVKQAFGLGGLFDIRKMILDETREFMFQSDLIDIDRGMIFFATSNSINQLAPEFSNTQSKVEGHLKDVLRNAGQ